VFVPRLGRSGKLGHHIFENPIRIKIPAKILSSSKAYSFKA